MSPDWVLRSIVLFQMSRSRMHIRNLDTYPDMLNIQGTDYLCIDFHHTFQRKYYFPCDIHQCNGTYDQHIHQYKQNFLDNCFVLNIDFHRNIFLQSWNNFQCSHIGNLHTNQCILHALDMDSPNTDFYRNQACNWQWLEKIVILPLFNLIDLFHDIHVYRCMTTKSRFWNIQYSKRLIYGGAPWPGSLFLTPIPARSFPPARSALGRRALEGACP